MRTISAAILIALSGQVATVIPQHTLFAFTSPEAAHKWQAVNDGVMGGVSDGRFQVSEEGTLAFFGTC